MPLGSYHLRRRPAALPPLTPPPCRRRRLSQGVCGGAAVPGQPAVHQQRDRAVLAAGRALPRRLLAPQDRQRPRLLPARPGRHCRGGLPRGQPRRRHAPPRQRRQRQRELGCAGRCGGYACSRQCKCCVPPPCACLARRRRGSRSCPAAPAAVHARRPWAAAATAAAAAPRAPSRCPCSRWWRSSFTMCRAGPLASRCGERAVLSSRRRRQLRGGARLCCGAAAPRLRPCKAPWSQRPLPPHRLAASGPLNARRAR